MIDDVRQKVLSVFFNTTLEEYDLVFTYNATHALKIIGECFPFAHGGQFVYLNEAHNSVIGIREYALERGAQFTAVSESELLDGVYGSSWNNSGSNDHSGSSNDEAHNTLSCNLFAYAPECNHTGAKYSLDWIEATHRGKMSFQHRGEDDSGKKKRWFVLLDASKHVSTDTLDLSKYKPDYVCMSFYKVFGLPSGLGALLVRKKGDAGKILRKVYFSGGTVMASSSTTPFHAFRNEIHEKFEDGTNAFMNIASLHKTLEMMPQFGVHSMEQVKRHTYGLAHFLYEQLEQLCHHNGSKVCEVYGKHHLNSMDHQGSIVNLNFLRSNGDYVGYSEVEKLAAYNDINIRTGCFCNPGACQTNLKLSAEEMVENFESGHVCWDDKGMKMMKIIPASYICFFLTIPS